MANVNVFRVVRAIGQFGYSDEQIKSGMVYARMKQADTDNDAFCMAISRILYSDAQLDDGEMFGGDIDEADADA